METQEVKVKKKMRVKDPVPGIRKALCGTGHCKEALKTLFNILIIVILFYGLVWIPSKQMEINRAQLAFSQQSYFMNANMAKLNLTKIQNSCQVVAQNALAAMEQKSEKKLTEEQRKKVAGQAFANCLYVEGLQIGNGKAPQKKSK